MKNIKRISLLVLLLMLAASLVFCFASCTQDEPDNNDDGGDGKVSYTVTVKDQYGTAVKGAKVQLYLDGVVPLGSKVDTDAEGKASISIKPQDGAIMANVEYLPTAYVPYTGNKVAVNASGEASVTVQIHPEYTVYVVDSNGNGVQGVWAQLCSGEVCKSPAMSDANGKISFRIEADPTYKAQIASVPEGYIKPEVKYDLVNNTVTIVLEAE